MNFKAYGRLLRRNEMTWMTAVLLWLRAMKSCEVWARKVPLWSKSCSADMRTQDQIQNTHVKLDAITSICHPSTLVEMGGWDRIPCSSQAIYTHVHSDNKRPCLTQERSGRLTPESVLYIPLSHPGMWHHIHTQEHAHRCYPWRDNSNKIYVKLISQFCLYQLMYVDLLDSYT